jgi:hypothetical protein
MRSSETSINFYEIALHNIFRATALRSRNRTYLWIVQQRCQQFRLCGLNGKAISEAWIRRNVEGSDRGLIWGSISDFFWRGWEKPWNTWVTITVSEPSLKPRPPVERPGAVPTRKQRTFMRSMDYGDIFRWLIGVYWLTIVTQYVGASSQKHYC